MKPIILFVILLFLFLIISLGINYSNVFKYTLENVQSYKPTPISNSKYTTPSNYYSDVNADQGVFSNTVKLTNYTVEPIVNKIKTPPKENITTWGYKGPIGAPFSKSKKEGYTNTQWPTTQSGTDYPNNDLGNFSLSTSDCGNKCANTTGCVGVVTGNEGENQCWLKSNLQSPVSNSDRNTYMMSNVIVDPEPATTEWGVKPNTVIMGNDLGCPSSNSTWAPTNNVDECKTTCKNTNGCNGISVGANNVCCLNSVVTNQGNNIQFDSYLYTPPNTSVTTTTEGIWEKMTNTAYPNPDGSTVVGTFPNLSDSDCQQKCLDTSTCAGLTNYVYDSGGSSCLLMSNTSGNFNYVKDGQIATSYKLNNSTTTTSTGTRNKPTPPSMPNPTKPSPPTPTMPNPTKPTMPTTTKPNKSTQNKSGRSNSNMNTFNKSSNIQSSLPEPAITSSSTAAGWSYNGPNVNAGKYSGPNVNAFAASGPNNSGYAIQGPTGNVYSGSTYSPQVGGCSSTQYGCCPDNETSKNADGSNCSTSPTASGWLYNGPNVNAGKYSGPNVSGYAASGPNNSGYAVQGPNGNMYTNATPTCNLSQYGCCPDNLTAKNVDGSNCAPVTASGCALTPYGCCTDNVTTKNADGSNCASATISGLLGSNVNAGKYSGPNVTAYAAKGPNNSGYVVQGPNENVYSGSSSDSVGGCSTTQYGCCPDNVTAKNSDGSSCNTTSGSCSNTQYGCCQDNITVKNANGSNCSTYPPPPVQQNTNTVFIPPPTMPPVENSPSSSSTYAPADDSKTDTSTTCPSCPTPQPCPPCGRCPEPSFDCKKVPNYSSTNSEYLPMPVLSDFSQFGM
jgi:hypothetical protein